MHRIQALFGVLHGSHRAVGRMGGHLEAVGSLLDVIVVAHPADGGIVHALEQLAGGIHKDLRFAVFTLGGPAHLAAQQMGHQLAAIADAQDGHAPGKDLGVAAGRVLQIDAVGAACKNDALGVFGTDHRQVGFIGIDLTVNIVLTHPARDQLIILAAKVQYDHRFMLHAVSSCILQKNVSLSNSIPYFQKKIDSFHRIMESSLPTSKQKAPPCPKGRKGRMA